MVWVELDELAGVAGFTGPRGGLSAPQRGALMHVLVVTGPSAAHYGDCVGADYEFFLLCQALGIYTVCHPPVDRRFRAFTHAAADEVRPMKDFLSRDWDIAVESDFLVATPKESCVPLNPDGSLRKRGSGTWTTVGYVWEQGKPVVLCWPDGGIKVCRGFLDGCTLSGFVWGIGP